MGDLRELLRPRVERGAALLDSVEPRWWKKVEEALDLSACDRCVLGQIYGDYADGLYELGLASGRAYGFARDYEEEPLEAYGVLTDLWLEAIKARRQS